MPEPRREIQVTVPNRLGLHTRPAKEFVQLACRFRASVEVSKGGRPVNGKSIMGLMSLLAPKGTILTIVATGEDAAEAATALGALVAAGFGEGA